MQRAFYRVSDFLSILLPLSGNDSLDNNLNRFSELSVRLSMPPTRPECGANPDNCKVPCAKGDYCDNCGTQNVCSLPVLLNVSDFSEHMIS